MPSILRNKLFLSVLFFSVKIPLNLFAQVNIGSKAPPIIVTDWLTKNQNPINLKEKFIVLEFWATWCAPCLEALPHLNKLQNTFAKQSNLLFLSITDENLKKITTIKNRFQFTSTIISDTTKKTLANFKVNYIPTTVLIDDKGIIKWIGNPNSLTTLIINDFLNYNPIIRKNVNDYKAVSLTEKALNDSLRKELTSSFYDRTIINFFEMSKHSTFVSKKSVSKTLKNIYNRLEIDIKIQDHFSYLLDTSPINIILPNDFRHLYLNYCFKRDSLKNPEEGKKILLNESLEKLGLKMKIIEQLSDVYIVKIVDSSKLRSNKIKNELQGNLSESEDKKLISIHNRPLIDLFSKLQILLNSNIFFDERNDTELYDITLRLGNLDQMKKSFNYYGLSIFKKKRFLKKIIFEK